MFERYTERARRVIFFARYEASQYGSSTIETEHLLLGLCREDKASFQDLLHMPVDQLRKKVAERLESKPKVSTSIDLPLSNECKRILAHAGEESERLGHRHIGTEHIILGILKEPGCGAARALVEMGAAADTLREAVAKMPASEFAEAFPILPLEEVDRSTLHELVDKLPEESLRWTKFMLDRTMERKRGGLMERVFQMRSRVEQLKRDTEGKVTDGRFSSSREEGDTLVIETQQYYRNHQISITERIRLSEDGKRLSLSQEVVGPKPSQQHRHAMEFDVA